MVGSCLVIGEIILHCAILMERLHLQNRIQLAVYAVHHGLDRLAAPALDTFLAGYILRASNYRKEKRKSALRRIERKTRLRAEWTSDNTTERFFDYVPKGTRQA